MPPFAGVPEGLKPQGRAYWPFGFIMGINYETSPEERAAVWMYLEWLSQPENLFKFQNGVEGENYTLDAEGIAVKKQIIRANRSWHRTITRTTGAS